MIKKCIVCNLDFTPRDARRITCSYECKCVLLSKRKYEYPNKICKFCGKEFKPYSTINKFCSSKCRVDNKKSKSKRNWTEEQISKRIGDKNPCFRTGTYQLNVKRTSIGQRLFERNAKEIEEKMIGDVGYKYCEFCGTSNSLRFERHHIIFRSEKPNHEYLHSKENILITCIGCHNKFHKEKGLRNQLVIERKLNELFGDDILDKRTYLDIKPTF